MVTILCTMYPDHIPYPLPLIPHNLYHHRKTYKRVPYTVYVRGTRFRSPVTMPDSSSRPRSQQLPNFT